jgi:hypothetical protein
MIPSIVSSERNLWARISRNPTPIVVDRLMDWWSKASGEGGNKRGFMAIGSY